MIEYKVGEKIGECVFIKDISTNKIGKRIALFLCHCGNYFENRIPDVKSGRVKSCGCGWVTKKLEFKKGEPVGECIFFKELENRNRGNNYSVRQALFLCKCGNKFEADIANVRSKNTTSCGCVKKEEFIKRLTKHGFCTAGSSKHPNYKIWTGIRARCSNSNEPVYKHYGGRGIKICQRWSDLETGFLNFTEDIGIRPSKNHSVDRKDVNGNYSCGNCKECIKNNWAANCRWATYKEQARNKRNNQNISFNNKTQCIAAWAEELGITSGALSRRIELWGMDKALSTPGCKNHQTVTYQGKTYSYSRWAEILGIDVSTLRGRIITKGWTVERAFTTDVNNHHLQITYNGETKSLSEWSSELNISRELLHTRIQDLGWSVHDAFTVLPGHRRPGYNRKNRLFSYKGVTKSLSEWAKELDMPINTLKNRLDSRNWTIEKAFTTLVQRKSAA